MEIRNKADRDVINIRCRYRPFCLDSMLRESSTTGYLVHNHEAPSLYLSHNVKKN